MKKFLTISFICLTTMAFGWTDKEDADDYFDWERGESSYYDYLHQNNGISYSDIWAEIHTKDYVLALYHLDKKEYKDTEDEVCQEMMRLYISIKMKAKKAVRSSVKRIELLAEEMAEE